MKPQKNNLLPQIEADLEAFVLHAARCSVTICRSKNEQTRFYHGGALEAYRQSAVRMVDLLMLANPAIRKHWRPVEPENLVDTMIQYQIEELNDEQTEAKE